METMQRNRNIINCLKWINMSFSPPKWICHLKFHCVSNGSLSAKQNCSAAFSKLPSSKSDQMWKNYPVIKFYDYSWKIYSCNHIKNLLLLKRRWKKSKIIYDVHNWSLKRSNTGWMLLKTLLCSVSCFNTPWNYKRTYTSWVFDVQGKRRNTWSIAAIWRSAGSSTLHWLSW